MKKLLLIFTAILTAFLLALPVYAADIRLSSSCSLADAIIAANRDRPEGDCPAGRGTDTIALTRDITLDGGLPKITSSITIEGDGYTISGDNRWRMFYNDGGALIIHDLAMTKGRVEGDIIRNADGIFKATTANPIGGAIVNWEGTVTISDSSFSGNSAEWGGAVFNFGELSISGSSFSHNSAGWGGAINNRGELSISDSAFNDNSAIGYENDPDFNARGGAISNIGELSMVNSTFSDNSADLAGGAVYNKDGTVSISSSTFIGNSTDGTGGAITNEGELSISDSSFRGNSVSFLGGAIDNDEGTLSISSSIFIYNSADWKGGAIRNIGELSIGNSTFLINLATGSGAIFNTGELSMVNSEFKDNSAKEYGGAIGNIGELSIVNSSFSGNSADEFGGSINNRDDGKLSISSSTFSGNSADKGGAIANSEYGELSIINSIIAGSGACYSSNKLKQNIRNFIRSGSCSPALRGDPMLGALVVPEDGSPAYFPLLAGSPAIDAADDGYCPETDQIGTERPQGAGCDIGAIEYAAP